MATNAPDRFHGKKGVPAGDRTDQFPDLTRYFSHRVPVKIPTHPKSGTGVWLPCVVMGLVVVKQD